MVKTPAEPDSLSSYAAQEKGGEVRVGSGPISVRDGLALVVIGALPEMKKRISRFRSSAIRGAWRDVST